MRKEAYLKALGTGLLRDPALDLVGAEHEPCVPALAPVGTVLTDLPAPPGRAAHAALCAIDHGPRGDLARRRRASELSMVVPVGHP